MIKNNKTALIIAGATLLLVLLVSFFFIGGNKKITQSINAIPQDAIFIFETSDMLNIFDDIKDEPKLYYKALNSKTLGGFFSQVSFLDSICQKEEVIEDFINSSSVVISIHALNNNETGALFVTSMKNKSTEKEIFDWLATFSEKNKKEISEIKYDKANLYKIPLKNENAIFFASYDGYFMMSFSDILLQKTIRQINSGISIAADTDFNKIYKSSHSRADGHFFINYKNLSHALGSTLSNQGKHIFKYLGVFANWSALDFNILNKKIHLTGFTSTTDSYLSVFDGADGQDDQILEMMPRRTSAFLVLGFTSGNEFAKKYKNYLLKNNLLGDYSRKVESFYKKYTLKEEKNDFYRKVAKSATLFYEDINKNGAAQRAYALLEVNETDYAKKFFVKMIENYSKANKDIPINSFYGTTTYNKDQSIEYFKLPQKNFMQIFFGNAFENLDGEYIAIYDNYVLFADSPKSISAWFQNISDGKVFAKRPDYKDLIYSLSSESNVLFYADLTHFKSGIYKLLETKNKADFRDDSEFFTSIKGPLIQFSTSTNPIYTSVQMVYEEAPETSSETVWELPGKNKFLTKPNIVINHNTNEKEVFIQDEKNKIYLISADGAILWERQLEEPILGQVTQVDVYKNNKLQLYFNTKSKIHCYDRNGNYLPGYPIKLPIPATSPVTVLDYDHNKNYRILIATLDKKITLYNIKGQKIEGWTFDKTASEVTAPIQYFRNLGLDYIVFHDKENVYITNRKGEIRVKPEYKFPLAKNAFFFLEAAGTKAARFVTTNVYGAVTFIDLKGKTSKITFKQFSPDVFFLFEDIDADGNNDYIFADKNKLEVYNKKKKLLFEHEFDSNITEQPGYYNFSKSDKRIGIVTGTENKIFLLDGSGNIFPNFPLSGTSSFSIGQLKASDKFGLIVGSADKYLYKYNL